LSGLPDDVDVVALGTSSTVLDQIVAGLPQCRPAVVPNTISSFRRVLAHAAPDLVHLNLVSFTSCRAAGVAAALQRIPMVLVDHAPMPGLSWRGRAVQRLFTRASAARIAPGAGAARNAEWYGGLAAGSVSSVPNGVPDPGCPTVQRPAEALVLGALARLEEEKGIDILIRALADVPGATILLAGDGSQREQLSRLATELNVADRVHFLGWVDSPCELLTRVHVLVAPSRTETMTLAVLEAMHAGLPVVVADVGSLREPVLDGETGFVVPPEDPRALAEACLRLAADPALRTRMGSAARIRAAEEFSVVTMATRYDARYRSVLGLPPRASAPRRRRSDPS
jgi:glycosyltransferase involved in cell wall biosynthesis